MFRNHKRNNHKNGPRFMHDPFLMLVRFLRDSRHNGKLPVYCHCARCVVLLQLIYQLIHGLIKLRDTLNKSGFRGKKAWIYGLFSAKTTLNQCFLSLFRRPERREVLFVQYRPMHHHPWRFLIPEAVGVELREVVAYAVEYDVEHGDRIVVARGFALEARS